MTVTEEAQAAAVEAGESHVHIGRGLLHARPWTAVALLMAVAAINTLDRFLPSILAEPMKRELGLSDTFLGSFNGALFLFPYAIVGLLIAAIADRGRYGWVISISVAFWSLMTGLAGLVSAPWQLASLRVGVALGKSGATPASHAYISRNLKPEQRAQAFSVVTAGMPLGNMLALVAGGLIAQQLGWRGAFVVMGAIGLAMAPIVRLGLGAGRSVPRAQAASRGDGGLLAVQLRKPSVVCICLASGLMAFGAYAQGMFAPAFLMREHGMSIGQAGVQLGLINGAFGMVATVAIGWLGGKLAKLDPRWAPGVLAAFSLVSIPFAIAAYGFVQGPTIPLFVSLALVGASGYFGLSVASLHMLVPGAVRARMSAILLLLTASFGAVGPVVTGMISDNFAHMGGHGSLGHALMLVAPTSYLVGAIAFLAATITFRRDMVREEVPAAAVA